MKPVDLNFNKPARKRPVAGMLLLAASIVVASVTLRAFFDAGEALDDAEARLTKLKRASERIKMFGTPQAGSNTTSIAASETQARPDWERLFTELERASSGTVALVSLTLGGHEIGFQGEAKNLSVITKFLGQVSRVPVLSNVRLLDQESVKEDPGHLVRFSAVARWVGEEQ